MAIIWCIVPDTWTMTDKIFCHFGLFFALVPPNKPKNQNFQKMKKTHGDIVILHMCIINDNHMMDGSWDIEHDRQTLLLFWTIFSPFTPLTTQKIKILKKWKKLLELLILYKNVPKIMVICYTIPNSYFLFWAIFCPFTDLMTQKIKILRQWKKGLEISSFYICTGLELVLCILQFAKLFLNLSETANQISSFLMKMRR